MSEQPTPPVAAPETSQDFQAMYEAEAAKTADLIRQRNFMKPAQQMLNGLDQDQRDELVKLGQMAALGDTDGMKQWMQFNLKELGASDVAAVVAAGQQAAAADAQQPTETLTRADVEKMAREIAANVTAEQQTKIDAQQRVTSELKTLGYTFESAPGRTILQYAIDNSLSLTDAADWYEKDTATSMAAKQQAAAAAAGQIPGVAPNGSPVGQFSPPERKAGESDADYRRSMIRARLENNTSAR